MATTAEKTAFINRVWNEIKGEEMTGFFPSVLIAQAALETGFGTDVLSTKYNAYFGIKATTSWTGPTVTVKTGEVINGQKVTVNGTFRVYNSLIESVRDRNKVLSQSRYAAVRTASSPQAQLEAIKAGGYATGTNYVNSIMSVVNANSLTKFDELKKKS